MAINIFLPASSQYDRSSPELAYVYFFFFFFFNNAIVERSNRKSRRCMIDLTGYSRQTMFYRARNYRVHANQLTNIHLSSSIRLLC